MTNNKKCLDKDGLPLRAGVYSIEDPYGGKDNTEIDVYRHWVKGLCCFSEDFGSAGTGANDRYDCHVSVQRTGLTFITRLRNFSYYGRDQSANEHVLSKEERRMVRTKKKDRNE